MDLIIFGGFSRVKASRIKPQHTSATSCDYCSLAVGSSYYLSLEVEGERYVTIYSHEILSLFENGELRVSSILSRLDECLFGHHAAISKQSPFELINKRTSTGKAA